MRCNLCKQLCNLLYADEDLIIFTGLFSKNEIQLSNMGEKAIKSHGEGKRHLARLELYLATRVIDFRHATSSSVSSTSALATSSN